MGKLFTDQDNVVELATFVAMGSHLHSRKPIRSLADIKGKVFAAQDSAGVKVLEKLGASASVMVGPDAYLAAAARRHRRRPLRLGLGEQFQAQRGDAPTTRCSTSIPGTYSTVMNKDTYNKLTPEEQKHLADITPLYFFYNTTDGAARRPRTCRQRTSSRSPPRTRPI